MSKRHYEDSPERKKRQARKRRAQEKAWKAKCGPVVVRHVDPVTLRQEPPKG